MCASFLLTNPGLVCAIPLTNGHLPFRVGLDFSRRLPLTNIHLPFRVGTMVGSRAGQQPFLLCPRMDRDPSLFGDRHIPFQRRTPFSARHNPFSDIPFQSGPPSQFGHEFTQTQVSDLPFSTPLVLYFRQAFGRAYGTVSEHARSPCLQHRPSACWGCCPQTPINSLNNLKSLKTSLKHGLHH